MNRCIVAHHLENQKKHRLPAFGFMVYTRLFCYEKMVDVRRAHIMWVFMDIQKETSPETIINQAFRELYCLYIPPCGKQRNQRTVNVIIAAMGSIWIKLKVWRSQMAQSLKSPKAPRLKKLLCTQFSLYSKQYKWCISIARIVSLTKAR